MSTMDIVSSKRETRHQFHDVGTWLPEVVRTGIEP